MADSKHDATTQTTELRPCPFCGYPAQLQGAGYRGAADCYDVVVECTGCEARGPTCVADQDDDNESIIIGIATEGWNRRVS